MFTMNDKIQTKNALKESAVAILKNNDRGGYTVPTDGLYPFQWNWDAAITALGWATFDRDRAWEEIDFLLKGQWKNGMVPHILFHQHSDSYFPNADVWAVSDNVRGDVPSTSISQPPVLASVVKLLVEQAESNAQERERVIAYLPKLLAYHLWWYRDRDPENTGLVVSYHPWESGMDNSPAWDDALAAVPAVDWSYQRRDTQHVDSSERPKQAEYDRYLFLVDFFIKQEFDAQKIYEHCPFKVQDLGIISILHRASKDLLSLCEQLQYQTEETTQLKAAMARTEQAIHQLWSEPHQSFLTKDVIANQFCEVQTTGTLLVLFAGLASPEQAQKISNLLEDWLAASDYGVASTYPKHPSYEPQRYWRGPVWLHINWMIAEGLKDYQFTEQHDNVVNTSKSLINNVGYWEYFNADTGEGCGGDVFSWTAAISLYWLLDDSND